MKQTNRLVRMTAILLLLALSACNIPTEPPQPGPAAYPAPVLSPTAPAISDAPTQAPAAPPVEPQPDSGKPVINAGNLSRLSQQTFGIPEWPERFVWSSDLAGLPEPLSPHPDLLLQAGANLHPVLLDPPGLGQPMPLPLNGTQPLAFAADGTSMVIKDPSRTALFSLEGRLLRELPDPANVNGASYSRDGRYLVLTSADSWQAVLYDLSADPTTGPVATLTGFETAAPIYDVSVAPGGHTIIWRARATIQIQNVAGGQLSAPVSYPDFIGNLSYSPDGAKLAVEAGNTLYLYSLPNGEELAKITLSGPLNSLDWSPDSQLLAAGYNTGLQLWDGMTLMPLLSLPGPNNFTGLLAFSPDGRFLVSIHENNLLGIWSIQ